MLYTIDGPFEGPKWAVFYRGPDGFGGNTESDGLPVRRDFRVSVPARLVTTNSFMVTTTEACDIIVYDAMGRKVKEVRAVHAGLSETPVDCEGWARGAYFVTAKNNGKVQTSKIIIMH